MEKILYIVDYFHNDCNSVADILHNTLEFFKDQYDQSVAKRGGYSYVTTTEVVIDGIPCFSARDTGGGIFNHHPLTIRYLSFKILSRIVSGRCRNYMYRKANLGYLKKILKRIKPDFVVYFCYSPDKALADLCIESHIPYCYALYDTYLKRPNILADCEAEEYVIQNSIKYLIPSFFYPDYEVHYHSNRISPYDLPLLISTDEVKKAQETEHQGYPFVYFGQLQAFRSTDEVMEIFRFLGYGLDVFTNDFVDENDTLCKHQPLKGDDLYAVIAHSNFLVAMDNNVPYEDYLPSKAYLYISFSKPIIVFGNNKQSAIRNFLKDYPYWYYQTIGESLDGLVAFIERYKDCECLPVDTAAYAQYLPENSINDIYQRVKQTLCF